jgi:hypothetical protein
MTELLEYGTFAVDHEARTVRGILLPWGQKSRPSTSKTKPITFPRGSVRIPRDPSVVGLNRMHDRFDWLGRAASLTDEDAGIVATFRIADTDEGDAWLADHGDLVKLSAEVKNILRNPDDTGTADLTGAALVDEGAFEAAALFAIGGDDDDENPDIIPGSDQGPDETPDEAPAPEDTEPDEQPDDQKEETVAEATAPATMLAGRAKPQTPALTKTGFFAALNTARKSGDRSALQPYVAEAEQVGLFALSNIKFDGAGGLITDSGAPGAWLGELWTGKTFQRRIVPLLTQKDLTAMSMTGWVWGVKPAMAAWAGNKTAVPSNAPTVTPKPFAATRFAGGHDLAREYYDFGVTEVIDSYADAMIDSYARLSDAYALTQVVAGATPYTPDPGNTVNTGLLDIVDGALAVIAAGGTPTWAIVAPDVFKQIIATPREDSLIFLDAAIGLESGSSSGFVIVPDARLTAGSIIVGDRAGATAWELPGVPIRVAAPDLVLGGIDNAFFGYIGVGVTTPAVVVKNTGVAGLVAGVEDDVIVAAEKSRK